MKLNTLEMPSDLSEPVLTKNALTILERRYLLKDVEGRVVETPKEMFWRVASYIAEPEAKYGGDSTVIARQFYDMMANLEFLPNSPTFTGSNTELGQLAACYVLPIEDTLQGILQTMQDAAIVHSTGGGTGFSFGRLRPEGARVKRTNGASSGPISFLMAYNAVTGAISQGGTRRGANMGIMPVTHPDVVKFIICKKENSSINNFNISVALTEDFMKAVENDEMVSASFEGKPAPYNIPANALPMVGTVKQDGNGYTCAYYAAGKCNEVPAKAIFEAMVLAAWQNGEPGIVFLDRINRDNPTPQIGEMESTNPCGEQPLLPYEACNLGSINLGNMLTTASDGKLAIDWEHLKQTVHLATRFLDNVIEMNNYPLPQIEAITKNGNRKVGLGIMGWADMLIRLGIAYNSDEAISLAEQLMQFIRQEARVQSCQLAKERGSFPNYEGSLFDNPNLNPDYAGEWAHQPQRNATVTTIAPTGTISIMAGASGGIEPLFAISFVRWQAGVEMVDVNPMFEKIAKERGFYSEELMKEIASKGTVQGLEGVPEDVQRVWVCSHDIAPEWHVKMQAAWQKHCDNAVSKTCNFTHEASIDYVREVYLLAYHEGLKGVTVYRDGSRFGQTLNIGKVKHKEEPIKIAETVTSLGEGCTITESGNHLWVMSEGCKKCKCGAAAC